MPQDIYDITAKSMITDFGGVIHVDLEDEKDKCGPSETYDYVNLKGRAIFLSINTVAQLLRRSGLVAAKEKQSKVKDRFDRAAERLERIDPEVVTITLDPEVVAGILRNGLGLARIEYGESPETKCIWQTSNNNSEQLIPTCTVNPLNAPMSAIWVESVKRFRCCPYCKKEIAIFDMTK